MSIPAAIITSARVATAVHRIMATSVLIIILLRNVKGQIDGRKALRARGGDHTS